MQQPTTFPGPDTTTFFFIRVWPTLLPRLANTYYQFSARLTLNIRSVFASQSLNWPALVLENQENEFFVNESHQLSTETKRKRKNERIETIGFPLKTHISPFFYTHSDGALLPNSADTAGWKSSLSEKPRQHPECRTKKNIFTYFLFSTC